MSAPPDRESIGHADEGDREAATRALLALLRSPASSIEVPARSEEEWRDLVDAALHHHVVPVLYRRLDQPGIRSLVPGPVLESLREMFAVRALRTMWALREAAAALRLLEERGIRTMVLKGVHLAADVYPEPALRGMADVDIMVDRENLAKAEAIFLERGWGPRTRPDVDEFCARSNHLAKLTKPGSVVLEIHYHIERPTSPFRIPVDVLWASARRLEIAGVTTLGLAPEELIIHLCIHASYHHQFSRAPLKALLDLRAVLDRHGPEIDWTRLCRIAAEWGASRFVYSTLRLLDLVLGAQIDERNIRSLAGGAEDDALVEAARYYILTPFADLPESYKAIAEPKGIRHVVGQVARGVFPAPEKMQALYGVKPRSPALPLYYLFFRPLDLLYRRGGLLWGLLFRRRGLRSTIQRERDRRTIQEWVNASHEKAAPQEQSRT